MNDFKIAAVLCCMLCVAAGVIVTVVGVVGVVAPVTDISVVAIVDGNVTVFITVDVVADVVNAVGVVI